MIFEDIKKQISEHMLHTRYKIPYGKMLGKLQADLESFLDESQIGTSEHFHSRKETCVESLMSDKQGNPMDGISAFDYGDKYHSAHKHAGATERLFGQTS